MQRYVLITPARDEAATLGTTIRSVTEQTILPQEWIIVSDGSTDGTDEIVQQAAGQHRFIRLLRLSKRPARNFASVVFAIDAGCAHLACTDYDYIGILDADIRLPSNYYETILARFRSDETLGLAGGLVVDRGAKDPPATRNTGDVAGAVQFFRRRCFESLGGLVAVPEGGWDAITCVQARMSGYSTNTFRDVRVEHLKPRNVHEGTPIRRAWCMGIRDYALATHPVYETLKCAARWNDRPLLCAALVRWCAFCWALLSRRRRVLPPEIISYRGREQTKYLLPFLKPRSACS